MIKYRGNFGFFATYTYNLGYADITEIPAVFKSQMRPIAMTQLNIRVIVKVKLFA